MYALLASAVEYIAGDIPAAERAEQLAEDESLDNAVLAAGLDVHRGLKRQHAVAAWARADAYRRRWRRRARSSSRRVEREPARWTVRSGVGPHAPGRGPVGRVSRIEQRPTAGASVYFRASAPDHGLTGRAKEPAGFSTPSPQGFAAVAACVE